MIDYLKVRAEYQPSTIKTLLIGEAPPPNGKTYFYLPKLMSLGKSVRDDTSLPATIFNHYFHKRPETLEQYKAYLNTLEMHGIYLIDIIDEPKRIRGNKENEEYLISKIPFLKEKIESRGLVIEEENWIFLLARNSYKKHLKKHYPLSTKIRWIDFRMDTSYPILLPLEDEENAHERS